MKPWLLVSGDFVKTGGMDRANYALAWYLAGRGHEVHLVAHRAADELLRLPNVTLHAAAKPLGSYYLGRRHVDKLGRKWARQIAARGGRVLVNGGNCNWADANWVHYVHAAYRPEVAGGLARRTVAGWKRRAFLSEERKALGAARIVIANSRRTRDDLVEHLGVDERRVRTVYLGTDAANVRPGTAVERAEKRRELGWDADVPVAVFIGALGDRRKNFDTVLAAWERLNRQRFECALAVIGHGAELPAWRERARAAGLGETIKFLGFRDDVPAVLRAADLMVAPARYEPYGLGVHEALCSAIPAVVGARSGVCERLPGELRDLIVADEEDADELADRVAAWGAARGRYRAIMVGVSQTLRQWTWDRMAEEMVRVIEVTGSEGGGDVMRMSA
ncbi:MAG: glycosyltransferase family 4 protein [Phycisphaerae bacterium]|nr:glycosyltransferase family 4 protein [Tepidisphaeraceae bacterium]